VDARNAGALRRRYADLQHFLQPDGYSAKALGLEHRVAPICNQITADGVFFDTEAAKRLGQQWTARRADLEKQLSRQFPGVKLTSRKQLGALLEARGWIPEKRTEKTKQPKIDDEVLESVAELFPEFTGLSEHFTLGRRIAQLATGDKAWLKYIAGDGRIHGGIVHIGTPHSRAKHLEPNLAQVPNPKKGTRFAMECRSLFRAPEGWVFVTADQAGLQDRGFAHYLANFDGGAYARTFTNGLDSETHWQSVITLGLVPTGTARDKDSKLHGVLREGAKRFRYAFLFGMGLARAGHIIGDIARAAHQVDADNDLQKHFFGAARPNEDSFKRVGKTALNKFEAGTPGLQQLRQKLQAHASDHKWLPGLDRRRVPVRALHSALNFIVTSSEAIICKRWLVLVHDELRARFRYGWDGDVVICLWVHDELVCCCRPEIAEQVGEIMVRHAKEPAEYYSFRVPLDAEYKIGSTWAGEPTDNRQVNANAATVCSQEASITVEIEPSTDIEFEPVHTSLSAAATSTATETYAEMHKTPDGNNAHNNQSHDRAQARGNYHDNHSEKHAGKPYTDAHLLAQGYQPASVRPYELPDGIKLYEERRYELRADIAPTEKKPRKTCRFCHLVNGATLFDTGPRRIIYNWPAILRAGPGATVHITEGANKSAALNAAGLLATAVAYHKWVPECIDALAGRHLIYHEDFDDNGRKFSADARKHLKGIAASFRIVPVAHLFKHLGREPWPTADVKDWIEAGGDASKLTDMCREIPVEGVATLPFIDFSNWDNEPAPPREWAVDDRIPLYQTTLFSGEGSAGKSSLQLQLSFAHVLMQEWLGVVPMPGPALFVDAEDNIDELHRRGDRVLAHYDATWADVHGTLHLMSFAGLDAVLAVVDRSGKIEPTPLYKLLLEAARDLKPKMIGIAAAANVFAGNENDRSQVQQFIGLLTRMAIAAGGTVQLISHPSLTGINTDTGLSGKTQWHNSVRARCYLRSVKPKDGEQPDSDLREMVFKKNNYGPISASIILRYQNGLFLPEPGVVSMDQATREATAQDVFLDLVKRFNEQNRMVSDKNCMNYAPMLFVEEDEAKLAGLTKADLKTAMRRLFRDNKIRNEPYGKQSRPHFRIVI
jgi:RecA-family ATPase